MSEKWLIVHSTGDGPHDGECRVYTGTAEEAQTFMHDTSYGASYMVPLDVVLKAIRDSQSLTLDSLDLR